MKKLLLLGGSKYIIPVIDIAHKLGIYVITCDYLPDNEAHRYADEYCNASVINKEDILEIAKSKQIDGILSFACDPGVVTAAYVAEQMDLPFQASYNSTSILQDKGLFRSFLESNGFNSPHSKRYSNDDQPLKDVEYFNWPVIVKPVDSAGSKGITRVDDPCKLMDAVQIAIDNSINGSFIIEDFITFDGYHSSADLFFVNGKIKFITYSDHIFDQDVENPYVPVSLILPASMKEEHQKYLTKELQRLADLLKFNTGIFNVETCVGMDGKPYIMEVSPRGGGCKIAELQELVYDVKFIENEVRSAVGMPLIDISPIDIDGCWCEMVIYPKSGKTGIYKGLKIDSDIEKKHIKIIDVIAKPGTKVSSFTGANMSLGNMILRFNNRKELDDRLNHIDEWLEIEIDSYS